MPQDTTCRLRARCSTPCTLKVYAMSNIARYDFARLKAVLPKWDLFDAEFTSFKAGMTKPDLSFYRHVIDDIGLRDPTSAVFVDDKVVNFNAARCFGIHGIVFKSPDDLIRKLRNEFRDPIVRARQFMKENARNYTSRIEDGPEFADTFSQFFIHQELQDTSLITLSPSTASGAEITAELLRVSTEAKTWNYFIDRPVGITATFPDDVDDTANALLAFSKLAVSANSVLDGMPANRHTGDGLFLTYYDPRQPRVCRFAAVNVVRVFAITTVAQTSNTSSNISVAVYLAADILTEQTCICPATPASTS
jgi:hypothetical protein